MEQTKAKSTLKSLIPFFLFLQHASRVINTTYRVCFHEIIFINSSVFLLEKQRKLLLKQRQNQTENNSNPEIKLLFV